jgi:long-chain-fatty-acid--CoA ligase ACSBG
MGSVGYCKNSFNLTKIKNPDENGNGEIAYFGRNVFMGYLNCEEKTKEIFDNDDWLLSGDLGKIENEYLYVTGRIKELIITAGGKNVSPVQIEEKILAQQPELISNCMVVGDQKSYLTVLITLKSKLDPKTGASLDELNDETINWLKLNGSFTTKVSEAAKDQVINSIIESAISKANQKSFDNVSKVRKFIILPRDFSIATGELGPTLKLRRNIVFKIYEREIENMYKL